MVMKSRRQISPRWVGFALAVALLGPIASVNALARDAEAPTEVAPLLDAAKGVLRAQLELIPAVTHLRFAGIERRDADDLVILYFEIRTYPYLASELAYMGSRCTPLATFTGDTFWMMGGGRGLIGPDDPELVFLRGPDQGTCR